MCFGKISKFPVFSLTGNFSFAFSLLSLCSGYPVNTKYVFFRLVLFYVMVRGDVKLFPGDALVLYLKSVAVTTSVGSVETSNRNKEN